MSQKTIKVLYATLIFVLILIIIGFATKPVKTYNLTSSTYSSYNELTKDMLRFNLCIDFEDTNKGTYNLDIMEIGVDTVSEKGTIQKVDYVEPPTNKPKTINYILTNSETKEIKNLYFNVYSRELVLNYQNKPYLMVKVFDVPTEIHYKTE